MARYDRGLLALEPSVPAGPGECEAPGGPRVAPPKLRRTKPWLPWLCGRPCWFEEDWLAEPMGIVCPGMVSVGACSPRVPPLGEADVAKLLQAAEEATAAAAAATAAAAAAALAEGGSAWPSPSALLPKTFLSDGDVLRTPGSDGDDRVLV